MATALTSSLVFSGETKAKWSALLVREGAELTEELRGGGGGDVQAQARLACMPAIYRIDFYLWRLRKYWLTGIDGGLASYYYYNAFIHKRNQHRTVPL